MITLGELLEMAEVANGRRRNRLIGENEANILLDWLKKAEEDETIKTIKVYSRQGFVANSYRSKCDISYFCASRRDNGWHVYASVVDAKRSYGYGALVTVNGRAV